VQFGMLVRAGVPGERVASGLTASATATTAAIFALPVVALLAGIGDAAAPEGLRKVAYIGGIAFALLGVAIIAALAWDAPPLVLGRGARAAAGWVGKRKRLEDLPAHLLIQRDGIRRAVAEHPFVAGLAALGKWGFDYLALLCVLQGLDVHAEPTLVLLAYAAAALLALIPLTPGGLGFVEAGLTGLLILAGVSAGDAAAATLAYRLVSYWLPLPAGLAGYWLGRHRYGSGPAPDANAAHS
jgi:uncharacterized membrane protein YbhN (UPF0104 family)